MELRTRFIKSDAALAETQQAIDAQSADALDFDAVDAKLRRVRSVEQAAETEIQQLREAMAGLNARRDQTRAIVISPRL